MIFVYSQEVMGPLVLSIFSQDSLQLCSRGKLEQRCASWKLGTHAKYGPPMYQCTRAVKKIVCHSLLAGPTLISHECMKLDSVCEQEYHASVLRVDMWIFHWYCWIIQFFAESVVTWTDRFSPFVCAYLFRDGHISENRQYVLDDPAHCLLMMLRGLRWERIRNLFVHPGL